MEAFFAFCGQKFQPLSLLIHRMDVYGELGEEGERKLYPWKIWVKKLSRLIITHMDFGGENLLVSAKEEEGRICQFNMSGGGRKTPGQYLYRQGEKYPEKHTLRFY